MADTPDRWERRRLRFEERMARRKLRWESRDFRGVHYRGGGMIIGFLLAAIGVLLLLQNLGILYVDDLWEYWPVILIVVGLSKVFNSWGFGGRVWGAIVAFVGAVFMLRNLGLFHTIMWNYFWPVILILIGIGMLLRHLDNEHPWHMDWPGGWQGGAGGPAGPNAGAAAPKPGFNAGPSGGAAPENFVRIDAVFSGAKRRIDSQSFGGGAILALFGGVELDLRHAAMTTEEVRIDANAIFGGIEIRVPETWKLEMHGTGVFGGVTDETHPPPRTGAKPPVLIITGSAVFGGVDVTN